MDFLIELIFGILFEVPLEAAMGSKKLKKSVKTALYCIFCGLILGFCVFLTYVLLRDGDVAAGVITGTITLGLGILFIWGLIQGLKTNWKND